MTVIMPTCRCYEYSTLGPAAAISIDYSEEKEASGHARRRQRFTIRSYIIAANQLDRRYPSCAADFRVPSAGYTRISLSTATKDQLVRTGAVITPSHNVFVIIIHLFCLAPPSNNSNSVLLLNLPFTICKLKKKGDTKPNDNSSDRNWT